LGKVVGLDYTNCSWVNLNWPIFVQHNLYCVKKFHGAEFSLRGYSCLSSQDIPMLTSVCFWILSWITWMKSTSSHLV
jgi:hypothetical protein